MTGQDPCRFGSAGTLQHRVIAEAIRAGNPRTRYGPTLPGLPASFVDIGSVETFRDEDVDYATRISPSGAVWCGTSSTADSASAAGIHRRWKTLPPQSTSWSTLEDVDTERVVAIGHSLGAAIAGPTT